MAREFQRSFEDMAREAELQDIKTEMDKLSRVDVRHRHRGDHRPRGRAAPQPGGAGRSPIARVEPMTIRRRGRRCTRPATIRTGACRFRPTRPASMPATPPLAPAGAAPRGHRDADREELMAIIKDIDEREMPLLDHLVELRNRLMYSAAAILVGFFVCYCFAERHLRLPGPSARQDLREHGATPTGG